MDRREVLSGIAASAAAAALPSAVFPEVNEMVTVTVRLPPAAFCPVVRWVAVLRIDPDGREFWVLSNPPEPMV